MAASGKRSRIQTENRAAILAAALDVFARDGYRGATVDRIAEAAGMSKPNLLYYFRSKEDIYREVLEGTVEEWLEPFTAIDPRGEPLEELSRYIRLKVAMSRENPAASRLFASEIQRGAPLMKTFLETRLRALVEEKAAIVLRWISEGRLAPVDPYHLIFTIWATTQHYADFGVQVRAIMGDRATTPWFHDDVAEAILSILLDGARRRD